MGWIARLWLLMGGVALLLGAMTGCVQGISYTLNGGLNTGQLLFGDAREHSGASELYTLDLRSGLRLNLTASARNDAAAAWSPDGRQIAYVSNHSGGMSDLFIVDSDGSNRRLLLDDFSNLSTSEVVWSPDGESLVYTARRDENIDLYHYDLTTTRERRLTFDPGRDRAPAFSPDGTRLIFTSDRDGNDNEVFILDLATRDLLQITDDWTWEFSPIWTDDDRIIFVSRRSGLGGMYSVALDGSDERRLTDPDFVSLDALSWLGDDWVMFNASLHPLASMHLYRVHIETGEVVQIGENITYLNPRWRP